MGWKGFPGFSLYTIRIQIKGWLLFYVYIFAFWNSFNTLKMEKLGPKLTKCGQKSDFIGQKAQKVTKKAENENFTYLKPHYMCLPSTFPLNWEKNRPVLWLLTMGGTLTTLHTWHTPSKFFIKKGDFFQWSPINLYIPINSHFNKK